MSAAPAMIRFMPSEISPLLRRHIYATHNADHANLNPAQHMAVQHYREQIARLVRKAETYSKFVATVGDSPLIREKRPSADQQDIAYELTQSFFDQVYATLSALASVHGRIRLLPYGPEPPTKSNDKFLSWWDVVLEGDWLKEHILTLKNARDFRTVFVHPQQWPIFDWGTVGHDGSLSVFLHGAPSSNGRTPPGSETSPNGREWRFIAPQMPEILSAFEALSTASFGPIISLFPLPADEETCLWEPDGWGSSIGDAAAQTIRTLLTGDDLPWYTRRLLAPELLSDLDHYIDAMAALRRRAAAIGPRASAQHTGIPAVQPLPEPFVPHSAIEPRSVAVRSAISSARPG